MRGKVSIVGAGPGDPELITVRGQRLLSEADCIIYAGSLVNPALLSLARLGCEIHDSASMALDEVIAVCDRVTAGGGMVVRLHTGDPSIYGAIREQMDALDALGIPYEVTPGVSSFVATAAALKKEYTLPGVTQTVILTRMEGRTPVPERERISQLARARATMCIFLSVQDISRLAEELSGGYGPETPVAVVYKASWPEQTIVRGTLADIAERVRDAGIRKTAMIVVGHFLGDTYELSKLYDPGFTHEYRTARE